MEMQIPSNPNDPNSDSTSSQHDSNNPLPIFGEAFNGPHSLHRRAHSDVTYRVPNDDEMGLSGGEPFNMASTAASVEDLGSEEDLFSRYIDVTKLGESGGEDGGGRREKNVRNRHRYSHSVDGSTGRGEDVIGEVVEFNKPMPRDKLAHLWAVDPKRAKRILANRQSAARSKEKKARYMLELERKVQTLQAEATTLTAQLSLFERDTRGLTSENAELKRRLQVMEQQARLRDAMNEALKQEVERLRIGGGEIILPSPRSIFSNPVQPVLSPFPPLRNSQHGILPCQLHPANYQTIIEDSQNDHLCLLFNNVSDRGSPLMVSDYNYLNADQLLMS